MSEALQAAVDEALTPHTCPTGEPRTCPHDACWMRPVECRAADRATTTEEA